MKKTSHTRAESAKKRGRPSKLSAEAQSVIVGWLKAGATIGAACRAAGVGQRTFEGWMLRGATGESPFLEFREAVEAVRPRRNWRYVAKKLERAFPEEWG